MEKLCFVVRIIALTMAFTACSGLNQETVSKDVELLEEINDDFQQIMKSRPIESNPPDIINSRFDVCRKSWLFLA